MLTDNSVVKNMKGHYGDLMDILIMEDMKEQDEKRKREQEIKEKEEEEKQRKGNE